VKAGGRTKLQRAGKERESHLHHPYVGSVQREVSPNVCKLVACVEIRKPTASMCDWYISMSYTIVVKVALGEPTHPYLYHSIIYALFTAYSGPN
jgi:hypothetical protein